MTIEKLTNIIMLGNERRIKSALRSLGYFDCRRDKRTKQVGSGQFFRPSGVRTTPVVERDIEYSGVICKRMQGYEPFEFVFVDIGKVYGGREVVPQRLLIYAREWASRER